MDFGIVRLRRILGIISLILVFKSPRKRMVNMTKFSSVASALCVVSLGCSGGSTYLEEGSWEVTEQAITANFCEGFGAEAILDEVFLEGLQFEGAVSGDDIEMTFPGGEMDTLPCVIHRGGFELYSNTYFDCSFEKVHLEEDEVEVNLSVGVKGYNYAMKGQDQTNREAMSLSIRVDGTCISEDCESFGGEDLANCIDSGMDLDVEAYHQDE